jgi:hypothetical protein
MVLMVYQGLNALLGLGPCKTLVAALICIKIAISIQWYGCFLGSNVRMALALACIASSVWP